MRLLPWFSRLTKARRPDKVCLSLGTSWYTIIVNTSIVEQFEYLIKSNAVKRKTVRKKLLCHNLGQKLCLKSQTYHSATYWIRMEESIFWLKVHLLFSPSKWSTNGLIHLHSINFSSYGFMPVTYLSCNSRGQRPTHLLAGLHLWMTNPAVCWQC